MLLFDHVLELHYRLLLSKDLRKHILNKLALVLVGENNVAGLHDLLMQGVQGQLLQVLQLLVLGLLLAVLNRHIGRHSVVICYLVAEYFWILTLMITLKI